MDGAIILKIKGSRTGRTGAESTSPGKENPSGGPSQRQALTRSPADEAIDKHRM